MAVTDIEDLREAKTSCDTGKSDTKEEEAPATASKAALGSRSSSSSSAADVAGPKKVEKEEASDSESDSSEEPLEEEEEVLDDVRVGDAPAAADRKSSGDSVASQSTREGGNEGTPAVDDLGSTKLSLSMIDFKLAEGEEDSPSKTRTEKIKELEEKAKKGSGGCSGGCSGCSQAPAVMSPSSAPAISTEPVTTSTFELFKVGIGPSSSHTVGPLVACRNFTKDLVDEKILENVNRIRVELCGSLALTGIGHYTNKAVVVGLTGIAPSKIDTNKMDGFLDEVAKQGTLKVGFGSESLGDFSVGTYKEINFDETRDVILFAEELPLHPNGMVCQALDKNEKIIKEMTYYSVGGGFVNTAEELMDGHHGSTHAPFPHQFGSMAELVQLCHDKKKNIADLMRDNEESLRTPLEVEDQLREIWRVMEACVDRGLAKDKDGDDLPGPLGIVRRAPGMYAHACEDEDPNSMIPVVSGLMDEMRWLDCYALAVMEENACMGQVVTAPTNGASGVVPAVLTYYMRHLRDKQPAHRRHSPSTFLLAAASVGILAKEKACISGAAGGCQAEVGTASAMAAAGLCAALGGTAEQVGEAAEIALEHSLGMTCDPVLGLVQVPCIERNTMGATKALNAVSLVLRSPISKRRAMLSYDDVLRVMKKTGMDMGSAYRETAQGGLAADYEASLQSQPEKWAEVKALMGVKRIQVGPRITPRKVISYEEVAEIRRAIPHLDLSVC
mmetsp:Transcript_1514/g.3190  ORF Transcript_1514/g.3190 Transcript_1514/m.3190 type:complete len:728 (-) Transcript_1514:58-2241(-)|eukprot:CAMPEP_0206526910 /NCGR_PEP_ID=MMETSP0325_2-20121206/1022_1 /ASSEMBLY_ACC=CAM_ASM_000347 /TAXON_ID=2866 /ORGANISM="Crypthecodinium cohnii, Strain Seligo" /LENGTH=727 /DNA_ID=CAMNT_0054022195 /DNA_START=138 /DNA_END=2321 /DNA_ORIENTATION=+